jgi:FG-GAP-like repeat/Divergent InlB B-repeat domain/FG-GAP repeat
MKIFPMLIQRVANGCACINRSLLNAIIFFAMAVTGAALPVTGALAQTGGTPGFSLTVKFFTVYGIGNVTSAPAGINCGFFAAACTTVIPSGTSVTLTATPEAGSYFAGWGGDGCSDVATTCTVSMTQAREISATFILGPRQITVVKSGTGDGVVTSTDGKINCGTICQTSFSFSGGIQLNARAARGSVFVGWSGAGCTGTATCSSFSLSDETVTAVFNRSLLPPPPLTAKPLDFNGDGKSDILVQNTAGSISSWLMDGVAISGTLNLLANDLSWTISHTGDFNEDGTEDILWRKADGSVTIWLINANTITATAGLIGPDASWRVSHVADFNGDGKADILWRKNDGSVTLWLMNGTSVISSIGLLGLDANWRVSHVGDFNGDGKADILWRNNDGGVTIWLMDGINVTSRVGILGADANWRVSHVADFDGDGKADLLWRNTNGAATIWLMNGYIVMKTAGILGADANWSVSHTADFNGDGSSDLLWRNTNGAVTMWLMSGTSIIAASGLIGPDPNWVVSHIADLNGDGKSDLIWRKLDGSITAWTMNGVTATATAGVTGPGTWRVIP